MCVGDVFMVTLNERFNVSVLTLKCFLDYTHMGQKDQDGYYAEKGHFFSTLLLKYTTLQRGLIKIKTCGAVICL